MRILTCHNFYSQAGGEDQSYRDETQLLASRGHEVIRFEPQNRDLRSGNKLKVIRQLVWNRELRDELEGLIRRHRPEIVHCHNTFPKISDTAYRLAARYQLPVVQSLRNYRTVCAAASLLRNAQPCRVCLTRRVQWPAVRYACYQGNRLQTAVIVARNYRQRARDGGIRGVRRYIALTEMAKRIFVQGGFPADRIVVKPNFVATDPEPAEEREDLVLYAGRLTAEKGVSVMLQAWEEHCRAVPLVVIGTGPLGASVAAAAQRNPLIRWLGEAPHDVVMDYMRRARILLMPSVGQETFGRTLIEAFAAGTPVVTSNHGSMAEIVADGVTGIQFTTGSAEACGRAIRSLWSDSTRWQVMSRNARETYENRYTAEQNYRQLMQIYQDVLHQDV